MQKSLIWTLALGLVALGGGGLFLARRGTAVAAADENVPLFVAQSQGAGRLLQVQAREPLRGVRWLPPMPGGWALCQVSTQSDRQLVGLFQDGQLARTFQLPRVEGVSEGFYRQAEIHDALLAQDTLILLLKTDGGHRDFSMVLALSLEGELRWVHRTQGDHLTHSEAALWVWGDAGIQQLPIALARGERPGPSMTRVGMPDALHWPYEVQNPTALLPTTDGFLVSHSKGLSAWRGERGWTHTPRPAPSTLGFGASQGVLVASAGVRYWQPESGVLLKVSTDAIVLGLETLPATAPELDAGLLKLLGCDGNGRLWFGLATPALPPSSQSSITAPPTADPTAIAEATKPAPLSAETRAALEAHLKAPLDRIYSWKPGDKAPRLITWSKVWPTLGAPASVPPPTNGSDLTPEAKGLLLGSDQARWWLPLSALP